MKKRESSWPKILQIPGEISNLMPLKCKARLKSMHPWWIKPIKLILQTISLNKRGPRWKNRQFPSGKIREPP